MKNIILIILIISLLGCNQQDKSFSNDKKNIADTIYLNGNIHTVDINQPRAEAIAIKDGLFLKIGANDTI